MAGANFDSQDLPVYDDEVEGIREGTTVRLGARQTLATRRGGPGRWRTLDWLVLNTDVVLASDDSDIDAPIARFIHFRPEFSTGGDHFNSDVMWQISDTLASIAEVQYNMERSEVVERRRKPRANLIDR